MADFLDRLREALAAVPPRRKYLVGVSGGLDSMALLHGLHRLGYRLVVCHLDHGLRGRASRADAALVRRTAKKLGLPLVAERVDTRAEAVRRRQSLELAAREQRYEFFTACARAQRCPRLFLAHHADDQVETIFFNFLRGTGAAGLAGMRPTSERGTLQILRPLLALSRSEIADFVRREKIPFREDASNREAAHTRNRLRHELLPLAEKIAPSFRAAILRAGTIAREESDWMESLTPAAADKLSTRELHALAPAPRRRLVLRWLKKNGVPEAGFAETTRILSLLNDGSGPARVSLPGNGQARRTAGKISLVRLPS